MARVGYLPNLPSVFQYDIPEANLSIHASYNYSITSLESLIHSLYLYLSLSLLLSYYIFIWCTLP